MSEKNQKEVLSKKSAADLRKQLNQLLNVERPKVEDELNFARSQGDLSENSDYDVARDKFEKINSEISRIQYVLDHAIIVEDSKDTSVVSLNRVVTCKRVDNGQVYVITIVGVHESDPLNSKISNESPVGSALIGHKVSDICHIDSKFPYDVEILSIK